MKNLAPKNVPLPVRAARLLRRLRHARGLGTGTGGGTEPQRDGGSVEAHGDPRWWDAPEWRLPRSEWMT